MATRARRAVITAAGRGTRQFPATRSVQKELLPLIDRDGLTRPTIQIIVEECLASGIEEVCIVVGKDGAGPFRNHFRGLTAQERQGLAGKDTLLAEAERLAGMETRISYVEQESPEGFGHAVYQARAFAGGEPFLLLLGDHVYTTPPGVARCAAQMLDIGSRAGGSVTGVRLEPEKDVSVTGIVQGEPRDSALAADAPGQTFDIVRLREKPSVAEVGELATPGLPAGYYLGHFGMHLFTPEIFDCLEYLIRHDRRVKNEIQLTSAQELLRERAAGGEAPPYRAALVNGTRWDIGMPDVYGETFLAFLLDGPFGSSLRERFRL